MNTYLSLLIAPLILTISATLIPWLGSYLIDKNEPLQIKELALPPGLRDLGQQDNTGVEAHVRLEALMPSFIVDRYVAHKGTQRNQQASDLMQLTSVLISDTNKAAILNGEVVFEGQRIGPYRVQKIAEDRVTVMGAKGREFVHLQARQFTPLFDIPHKDKGAVVSLSTNKSAQDVNAPPALPAHELERQFRKLLENFSH